MSSATSLRKTAVRCESCRSIFTAEVGGDGSVFLMGVGENCPCGGSAFQQFS